MFASVHFKAGSAPEMASASIRRPSPTRAAGSAALAGERARAIFEAAFREYRMPESIRTNNGAPFASTAVAGLSRLAVRRMKPGIMPERIQAGHLEQNGRHERMHRALTAES